MLQHLSHDDGCHAIDEETSKPLAQFATISAALGGHSNIQVGEHQHHQEDVAHLIWGDETKASTKSVKLLF